MKHRRLVSILVCNVLFLSSTWGTTQEETGNPSLDEILAVVEPSNTVTISDDRSRLRGGDLHGFLGLYGDSHYRAISQTNPDDLDDFVLENVEETALFWPGRIVKWKMASEIRQGEHIPFAGQVYRWDGRNHQFVRDAKHRLGRSLKVGVHTFSFNHSLSLKLRRKNLLRLAVNFTDQTPDKNGIPHVLMYIRSDAEQIKSPPMSAKVVDRDGLFAIREGDAILTETWDLKVRRIVFPSKKDWLAGWVEVELR